MMCVTLDIIWRLRVRHRVQHVFVFSALLGGNSRVIITVLVQKHVKHFSSKL